MTFAILTNTGRNKEAAAIATGTALSITEMAWGNGERVPAGGETALEAEQGRKALQASGTVSGAANTAYFEVLLDETEGPFVIHEVGLFDADGDMIAIAHFDPPVNKPLNTVSARLRVNILFSDLENLILKVQATDAYVPAERQLIAGDGLTGGGTLDEDVTFGLDDARVTALVQPMIDALVGAAPAAMDTLAELAVALGDSDSEIAALVTQIAGKLGVNDQAADAATVGGYSAQYLRNAGNLNAGYLSPARLLMASWTDALAGTRNDRVMTPLRTKEAIGKLSLGYDQTWQDMTASRAANTSYQNTTGKPIEVVIHANGSWTAEVSDDAATWVKTGKFDFQNVCAFIVPNGHYYRINGAFTSWSELQ